MLLFCACFALLGYLSVYINRFISFDCGPFVCSFCWFYNVFVLIHLDGLAVEEAASSDEDPVFKFWRSYK